MILSLASGLVKSVAGFARAHLFISIIVAVALIGGGWWGYGKFNTASGETRYVLGTVRRGLVAASVSASGQISAQDQVVIESKVSGNVTWVGVKNGDAVGAGQALIRIDSNKARQALLDAESSLAQMKLQYQKDSGQAPIDYEKATETLAIAKKDLVTTYNDSFNTVSATYLNLPTVMTCMQNVL